MSNPSSLTVGYYGGMANNAYVAAKSAQALGYKSIYIRELADSFPFSQPVWEDVYLTVPYDDIYQKIWTQDIWREIEQNHQWTAPDWIVTPRENPEKQSVVDYIKEHGFGFKSIASYFYLRRSARRIAVADAMRRCDALFVCGVEAEILAWCSGVPYVIWPHGGDIRLASGLIPHQGKGLRSFITYWANRAYLHMAYKGAEWIGTHDCKGITGEMGKVRFPIDLFPMPMPAQLRAAAKADRHANLKATAKSLGITLPEAKFYFFVPSRINFFWKKTHMLVNAIRELSGPSQCHFIFSGWGEDYEEMKRMTNSENVTFLPCSISKPYVMKFFKGVDLVIDQFYLGAYGTAAVEAMSCGVPVMMYVETESFLKRGWSPPPALNARDENDILRILRNIVKGDVDLEQEGAKLHQWFLDVHHDERVIPAFYKKLKQKLSAQGTRHPGSHDAVYNSLHERKTQS